MIGLPAETMIVVEGRMEPQMFSLLAQCGGFRLFTGGHEKCEEIARLLETAGHWSSLPYCSVAFPELGGWKCPARRLGDNYAILDGVQSVILRGGFSVHFGGEVVEDSNCSRIE